MWVEGNLNFLCNFSPSKKNEYYEDGKMLAMVDLGAGGEDIDAFESCCSWQPSVFFLKCSVSRCPGCHLACVMKEGEREEMH